MSAPDPAAAAAYARGDADEIAAPPPADTADAPGAPPRADAPDGAADGFTTGSKWLDRLLDGSLPGPPVAQLEADYGLDQGLALMLRGVLRVAPGDGIPPLFEIGGGGILALRKRSTASSDGGDEGGELGEPDYGGIDDTEVVNHGQGAVA